MSKPQKEEKTAKEQDQVKISPFQKNHRKKVGLERKTIILDPLKAIWIEEKITELKDQQEISSLQRNHNKQVGLEPEAYMDPLKGS